MRRFFILLILSAGMALLLGGRSRIARSSATVRPVYADSMVPDFFLPDTAGNMVCFSQYAGKLVLIDFWASWCGPCRTEFEALRRLRRQIPDTNFVILGISVDVQRRQWLQALHEEQLPWPQLHDDYRKYNLAAGIFGVTSLPTTFLIDRRGKMRYRDLKGQVLVNVIKGWLKEGV